MKDKKVIDLHCHILPGLDDGISTMEDAIEACRIAKDDGIEGIVATPHMREGFFEVSPAEAKRSLFILQEGIKQQGIEIDLFPGAEVHITDNLSQKVNDGSVLTINDTKKYLLLELSYQQYPVEFERLLFSLKISGITPILAHPERVRYFEDDMERISRAVHLGALTQVTSSSILGTFGEDVRRFSLEMASRGLVHIIASDSHDIISRPPTLMEACKEMAKIVGEKEASAMVKDHPSSIVYGEGIKIHAPISKENNNKKTGSLSFLRHLYKKNQN